jgi:hypothetical protein
MSKAPGSKHSLSINGCMRKVSDEHSSSSTEDWYTDFLLLVSRDQAWMRMKILTICQRKRDDFGQQGSSSAADENTHRLWMEIGNLLRQKCSSSTDDEYSHLLWTDTWCLRSACAELNKSPHSQSVMSTDQQCFPWATTENEHTHSLTTKQKLFQWANKEVSGRWIHLQAVDGRAISLVSIARVWWRMSTLTFCRGISNYIWWGRLEFDERLMYSLSVNRLAITVVSKARAPWRINTLTRCWQSRN